MYKSFALFILVCLCLCLCLYILSHHRYFKISQFSSFDLQGVVSFRGQCHRRALFIVLFLYALSYCFLLMLLVTELFVLIVLF